MHSRQNNGHPGPEKRRRDPDSRIWAERHPWLSALGLIALAVAALIAIWDWNWFRGPVERLVEARTGRDFEIGGQFDVDLGRTPVISLVDVRFGNAAWSRQPTMASAQRARLRVALGSLLLGRMRVYELQLTQPRLLLEADPKGGAG